MTLSCVIFEKDYQQCRVTFTIEQQRLFVWTQVFYIILHAVSLEVFLYLNMYKGDHFDLIV